eukprot:PhF_6_TR7029/c0_g1_i2/m.10526
MWCCYNFKMILVLLNQTPKHYVLRIPKMLRITFPRPVVNLTLKTILDGVECFRDCEIFTTNLNVMYDGVFHSIPFSPPSGQAMRYRLLYSMLCIVWQHLKARKAIASHVTPFMLRL